MENDALDLGTEFCIDFSKLANNHEDFTVQELITELITALEATTTLTKLWDHLSWQWRV
jgi:hypothetical protein